VGEGPVLAQWEYYYLIINESITPTNVFDISIDSGNPSSHKININYIKCAKMTEEGWHDNETGEIIEEYNAMLFYNVTADEIINESNVYLSMTISHRVIDDNNVSRIILETMIERVTFNVPSLDTEYQHVTPMIPMIDHGNAGTDNITIYIDVDVTVMGSLNGSGEWISKSKSYVGIRQFTAWWY
jgi:hypothetical protein